MSRARLFINDSKPCIETKGLVVEEDWKFLMEVYPEHGFRAYFIGHCISKLANHLRSHDIHSCDTRLSRSEFATITGLLSHIKFATPQEQDVKNERCRTRREGEEDARGTGESGYHALVALGEAEEGKCEVKEIPTQSVPVGPLKEGNIIMG